MSSGPESDAKYPATIAVPERFVGPRVVLRAYTAGDAVALKEAVDGSRERLRPFIPWAETHQRIEETRQLIAEWEGHRITRQNFVLGLFDGKSGRLLGGSGLHPAGRPKIDWDLRRFEIGYWLRTGEEGKGYTLEAVNVLTAVAFTTLRARRVEIRCDTGNERSIRVARAAGYRFEGVHRKDGLTPSGLPRDTCVYALTDDDPRPTGWTLRAATSGGRSTTLPEFGERLSGRAYAPRPGAYAIAFDDEGRVAVVSTKKGIFLPGGGAEKGETRQQALAREVREECGLDVTKSRLVAEAVEHVISEGEGAFSKECAFFRTEWKPAAHPATEPDHELCWLAPEDALARLAHKSQAWAVARCIDHSR